MQRKISRNLFIQMKSIHILIVLLPMFARLPTLPNLFKIKTNAWWSDKITLIGEKLVKVDVRLMFSEETYYVFRATKSAEPILKKRDGLFALARILRLRQARPDNYWLLNSALARRSQKSAAMPRDHRQL